MMKQRERLEKKNSIPTLTQNILYYKYLLHI